MARASTPRPNTTKSNFALRAAAMLHGGVEPGLLDEVQWWQTDDTWYWSLEALVAYVRAAADRAGEPGRVDLSPDRRRPRHQYHRVTPARDRLPDVAAPPPGPTRRCRSMLRRWWAVFVDSVLSFGRAVRGAHGPATFDRLGSSSDRVGPRRHGRPASSSVGCVPRGESPRTAALARSPEGWRRSAQRRRASSRFACSWTASSMETDKLGAPIAASLPTIRLPELSDAFLVWGRTGRETWMRRVMPAQPPARARRSASRWAGSATAISRSARWRSVAPRRSATPCSVMTRSASARGVVVTASPRRVTMREMAPSAAVEGRAMIDRPCGAAAPARANAPWPPTAPM